MNNEWKFKWVCPKCRHTSYFKAGAGEHEIECKNCENKMKMNLELI